MTVSKIEWTDRSDWNPIRGCTRASEGCRFCYAEAIAARFSDPGQPFHGFAKRTPSGPRWTGKIELQESRLDLPLRWRKPSRVFVNSTFDLFHEAVPDEWIDRVFAVMALAPQHIFQVLTKRAVRMRDYLQRIDDQFHANADALNERFGEHCIQLSGDPYADAWFEDEVNWPLPNVWLGISAEDQPHLEERWKAAGDLAELGWRIFLSAEPLLGPLDLTRVETVPNGNRRSGIRVNILTGKHHESGVVAPDYRLSWVIAGGESGPNARPMHPDWARSLRDQCHAAGVPFFMKQMTKKAPIPGDLFIREFPHA